MKTVGGYTAFGTAFALIVFTAAAGELPVGHPDFRPTPERPMGYRGDGTGCYPGATMVDHFDERTGKNILWKTETPVWGNAGLAVVGDRIFTTCEPWTVLCYSAKDGKLLWQKDLNPFAAAGLDGKELENANKLFEGVTATRAFSYLMLNLSGGENHRWKKVIPPEMWDRAFQTLRNLKAITVAWAPASATGWDAAIAELEDRQKTQMERNQGIKGIEGLYDNVLKTLPPAPKGVPLTHCWHTMIGYTMATPVTDGKHVFVSMGHGQAGCFDLDGNLVWQIYRDPRLVNDQGQVGNRVELRANHAPSPLLAGDRLIVQFEKFLAGIDKRTGAVVWTDEQKVGGGYNVGTHRVLRLPIAGGKQTLDIIVTTRGRVLRATDGKLMAELKMSMAGDESGGCSVPAVGNLVILEGLKEWKGFELMAASPDAIEVKELWATGGGGGREAVIPLPDRFLKLGFQRPSVCNPRTGERTKFRFRIYLDKVTDVQSGGEVGSASILVGDRVLLTSGGAEGYMRPAGKSVYVPYAILDKEGNIPAEQCAKGQDFYDNEKLSFLGGLSNPRDPIIENYLPDWYTAGDLSHEFRPAYFSHCHSGPVAQGNRLYVRSTSHLYCIGAPEGD